MIRIALLNHDGQAILPKDLTSAADIRDAVDQARNLILECNCVVLQNAPNNAQGDRGTGVPYRT
jgi:hypothetical protein